MSRLGKVTIGVVPLVALAAVTAIKAPAEGAKPPPAAARPTTRVAGAAFAMTNVVDDNRIITYSRAGDGRLTRVGSVSTRGNGIGTDLDTQGSLRLSADHRFLYAANAGSDDVSVFSVNGSDLTFLQKVYAGDEPNSMTLHDGLLYVLDGSVAGNGILGFTIGDDGRLTVIPHSARLLSSPIAVPGDIEFSPDGALLLVTEKTTNASMSPSNAIDAFRVRSDGRTSSLPRRDASSGLRPFSMAFRSDGTLVVAESFNAGPGVSAASSYDVTADGSLHVTSSSVGNGQTDTCWIVLTDDGRYAFTANFGSGTISSYGVSETGQLTLIEGGAASLGAESQPVDLALSAKSHYLYLLLRGSGAVAAFEVGFGGQLKPLGVVGGALPVADGASGLAAY